MPPLLPTVAVEALQPAQQHARDEPGTFLRVLRPMGVHRYDRGQDLLDAALARRTATNRIAKAP